MAGSVNKVILVGNLGADPEVRHLNSGDPVVNLRIATSESWKGKDGEKQERTTWHQVVIFNEHIAKVAENYLKKGSKIYLEGQLQTRKWQDQSGNDRYSTEIVLQRYQGELVLLGSKDANEGQSARPAASENRQTTSQDYSAAKDGGKPANFSQDMDDEIPFIMEWR